MKLRRVGIWSSVSVTPGHVRVATLALLCKAVTWNAVRAPNPIPHQRRGRGRGLGALLHDHPYNPSGAIGMGRTRVETLAFANSLIPLCESLICGPDAYAHKGIFPAPHLDLTPLLEAQSGPPSLESITSSESSE